jgi:hypothetical protein
MTTRKTWTDREVILLLHAEDIEELYRARVPAVTEGRVTSPAGARRLAAELPRRRMHFTCSKASARPQARRALKALLAEFRRSERNDEWLRRQLERLGQVSSDPLSSLPGSRHI